MARATGEDQRMAMVVLVALRLVKHIRIKRVAGDGSWIRDFGPPAGVFGKGEWGSEADVFDDKFAAVRRAIIENMAGLWRMKSDS